MKEIVNDLLGYEGLKIIQRPDIFNFSLDSTLLAHFVSINLNDKKIVDLGCGNGPIPLFLSLRTKGKIFGVEIQKDIADLAQRSVSMNNLDEQITIINQDIFTVHKLLGVATFDVVTCNPPYFKHQSDSLTNESSCKTIARHEVSMKLEDAIIVANRLLKDGGTFAMSHRVDRLVDCLTLLRNSNFEPKRIQFVYPKVGTDALVLLIEAKKKGKPGNLKILEPLFVSDNGAYTPEILEIFNYRGEK